MKYYQDITLLPDTEIPLHFLLSKVFSQIHLEFAEVKNREGNIPYALSFPEYGENTLGTKLRIFSNEKAELEKLDLRIKLSKFEDYIHITRIRDVPTNVKEYEIFSRYQVDGSVHQKAKRYVKRHDGVTYEEAVKFLQQKVSKTKLPYIQMISLSNRNHFRLFVKRTTVNSPLQGECGSYGLSLQCAIPKF
mgnify:FL=1|jgi:CRISPR-associated endonuclease Csy4